MLEEGEHVSLLERILNAILNLRKFFLGVIRAAQAIVGEVGCMHFFGNEVVAFRNAQRDIVFAEDGKDLFVEPAFMAKLERISLPFGQQHQKRSQAITICFQVWRQLKKNRSEPLSVSQRTQ